MKLTTRQKCEIIARDRLGFGKRFERDLTPAQKKAVRKRVSRMLRTLKRHGVRLEGGDPAPEPKTSLEAMEERAEDA